jgi:hypothetical protein
VAATRQLCPLRKQTASAPPTPVTSPSSPVIISISSARIPIDELAASREASHSASRLTPSQAVWRITLTLSRSSALGFSRGACILRRFCQRQASARRMALCGKPGPPPATTAGKEEQNRRKGPQEPEHSAERRFQFPSIL